VSPLIDVLIPTYQRPAALAVTLAGLAGQAYKDFRLVISDQNEDMDVEQLVEVRAMLQILRSHGHQVDIHKHLPRQGIAEQRQFLLDQARAPFCMFLDDDVYLEPYVVGMMLRVLTEEGCAFTGNAVIGLSYANDTRSHEQHVELWNGAVLPERVDPQSAAWNRHRLHNAANLLHVQQRLGATPEKPLLYKIAWIGGCSMYDTAKLREIGGFDFWKHLPPNHSGEDVMVQLILMARYGGCGIMPSGAYHLELPTTIPNREVDAPELLLRLDNTPPKPGKGFSFLSLY
jgi:glycosyltransferase involved in cell wall biosynthesis